MLNFTPDFAILTSCLLTVCRPSPTPSSCTRPMCWGAGGTPSTPPRPSSSLVTPATGASAWAAPTATRAAWTQVSGLQTNVTASAPSSPSAVPAVLCRERAGGLSRVRPQPAGRPAVALRKTQEGPHFPLLHGERRLQLYFVVFRTPPPPL